MKILLSKITSERNDDFKVMTNVIVNTKKNKYVVKKAMNRSAWNHLISIKDIYKIIKKNSTIKISKILKIDEKNNEIWFKYVNGKTIECLIEDSMLNRNFEKTLNLYKKTMSIIDSFSIKKKPSIKYLEFINEYQGKEIISRRFVPFSDISTDHLIMKNDEIYLIDYENFLGFDLPVDFVKFRSEFYLLINLQQIIQTISSNSFQIESYLSGIYIPAILKRINNFSEDQKKFFLFLEEKLQNTLNWKKVNLNDYINYDKKIFKKRLSTKINNFEMRKNTDLTNQNIVLKSQLLSIYDSKFYKLWRLYNKFKSIIS